ncbi:hypothetical protein CYY_003005 [Polysphondylium violaceum]|uniref:Rab GTPase n=1 Tax=Polysphondylium violaceum TaxID=133409 RepID=A0A8J4V6C3_9MYCE|nr:hypothetical protein CYY_003005 [Polysphondylium violaceum]
MDPVLLRFIFFGQWGSGKTSASTRYCEDHYSDHYSVHVGIDFRIKRFNNLDPNMILQVWDKKTHRGSRTDIYPLILFRDANAIFVFFDVTNRESFDFVEQEIQQIPPLHDIELYIVGTKIDLETKRIISREEAIEFAQKYTAKYFEISAKENINVHQSFDNIVKSIFFKKINEFSESQPSIATSTTPTNTSTPTPITKSDCIIQ